MTYRDTFDTCPRCGVSLVDARSARGCPDCKGLWVEEPIVGEMVLEMLPPQPFGRLVLAVLERTDETLACPTCKQPMQATAIHGVPIDRCAKQHGVWFDAGELEVALRRVADPALPPPLADGATIEAASRPVTPVKPPIPIERGEPPQDWSLPPVEFRFTITTPGEPARELAVTKPIVKIGRAQTSTILLTDPDVSRMHAIIEASAQGDVMLIDLGAESGTFVNGERVIKSQLESGDRITVGATVIDVTYRFALDNVTAAVGRGYPP